MKHQIPLAKKPGLSADGTAVQTSQPLANNFQSLGDAISIHNSLEKVSLHVPGHKGSWWNQSLAGSDQTEIGNLDDLTDPQGVLLALEERLSRLSGAAASVISVNGASAALISALLTACPQGRSLALPRHCHRSAVNALVLGGIEPVWYEANWDADWGIWSGVDPQAIKQLLVEHENISAVLVVSPTYEGVVEPIAEISRICKDHGVALVVDEAHGAHMLPGAGFGDGALAQGADLVIHSLHKTLPALTQTGALHLGRSTQFTASELRRRLNLVTSSSPSYLLMSSIDQMVSRLIDDAGTAGPLLAGQLEAFRAQLRALGCTVRGGDLFHCLVRDDDGRLGEHLERGGFYPEARLGRGLLLMFGFGTCGEDLAYLTDHIGQAPRVMTAKTQVPVPERGEQVLSPRQAFFATTELVPSRLSAGRIAAECLAPCPPGSPIFVPGERICESQIERFADEKLLRVVVELQGDA